MNNIFLYLTAVCLIISGGQASAIGLQSLWPFSKKKTTTTTNKPKKVSFGAVAVVSPAVVDEEKTISAKAKIVPELVLTKEDIKALSLGKPDKKGVWVFDPQDQKRINALRQAVVDYRSVHYFTKLGQKSEYPAEYIAELTRLVERLQQVSFELDDSAKKQFETSNKLKSVKKRIKELELKKRPINPMVSSQETVLSSQLTDLENKIDGIYKIKILLCKDLIELYLKTFAKKEDS